MIQRGTYQVVPMKGKGLGAIATTFIKQGSVIVDSDPGLLRVMIREMQVFDQQHLDLDRRSECYFDLRATYFQPMLEEQLLLLPQGLQEAIMGLHDRAGEASKSVAGIFFTNAIATEGDDFVLCHMVGRFNSSCQQNAVYEWCDREASASVRAVWDIAKGEEICIFYGSTGDLLKPRRERQEFLRYWGFTCACSSCMDPLSDERRARILEIKRAFEDENVIKIPIIQRYELAKEQLRLYQKERVFFSGYFQALTNCVQLSQSAHEEPQERRHLAELAVHHVKVFFPQNDHLLKECHKALGLTSAEPNLA
ncbi:unnamed protein product [Durusdinium trenchii]|uniref:SET domain-containing protein n=2 Tax=Durusdinium trenchii TaxID=1381693 RepID=A0ABP0K4J2_9DINO